MYIFLTLLLTLISSSLSPPYPPFLSHAPLSVSLPPSPPQKPNPRPPKLRGTPVTGRANDIILLPYKLLIIMIIFYEITGSAILTITVNAIMALTFQRLRVTLLPPGHDDRFPLTNRRRPTFHAQQLVVIKRRRSNDSGGGDDWQR